MGYSTERLKLEPLSNSKVPLGDSSDRHCAAHLQPRPHSHAYDHCVNETWNLHSHGLAGTRRMMPPFHSVELARPCSFIYFLLLIYRGHMNSTIVNNMKPIEVN
jgi:hypothetical protein